MTGAAYRRAIAGLFLPGSYDRSVPRSCSGSQVKGAERFVRYLFRIPRPREESADFEAEMVGSFEAEKICEEPDGHAGFDGLCTQCKPQKRQRLPQKPHTASQSPRHFAAER